MSEDRDTRRFERHARKAAHQREKWEAKEARRAPWESLDHLSGPELDAAIRRRIERRAKERNEFIVQLIAFVGVNLTLWAIWLTWSAGKGKLDFPWPIFITFGWGIGLAAQGFRVYENSARVASRREATIQREIALEKMRLGLEDRDGDYEKPKRDRLMHLSDDGELMPDEDSDTLPLEKAKNG